MVHSGTRPTVSSGFWEQLTPSATGRLLIPGGADAGGVYPPLNTASSPLGAQCALVATAILTPGNGVADSQVIMQKYAGSGVGIWNWSAAFDGTTGNVDINLRVNNIIVFTAQVTSGFSPILPVFGMGYKATLIGSTLTFYWYWSADGVTFVQVHSAVRSTSSSPSAISLIDRINCGFANWSGGSVRKIPIRNVTNQVILP